MSYGMVVGDEAGRPLSHGDVVRVKVGTGSTMRPGVVTGLTTKNVKVRFEWANGRVTDRRFGVAQLHTGLLTPGVQFVRTGEGV